jgi:hypothetical protein
MKKCVYLAAYRWEESASAPDFLICHWVWYQYASRVRVDDCGEIAITPSRTILGILPGRIGYTLISTRAQVVEIVC